jgi:hypothetical protein
MFKLYMSVEIGRAKKQFSYCDCELEWMLDSPKTPVKVSQASSNKHCVVAQCPDHISEMLNREEEDYYVIGAVC